MKSVSDTQNEMAENLPPDWAVREKDLLCPLCGYNLRGLTEPRCPECGFKFTWQELLDAEKDRQLYLFEYGSGRNIQTFWKTYWRTCRPRRFWREISPANEVRWVRLIVYWVLTSSIVATIALFPRAKSAWHVASRNYSLRATYTPVKGWPAHFSDYSGGTIFTANELDGNFPLPWHPGFWDQVLGDRMGGYSETYTHIPLIENIAAPVCMIFLGWPVLTLTTLMTFRISMRQSKIRTSHLVRAVVYSCDYGLVIAVVFFAGSFFCDRLNEGSNIAAFAVFCAAFTTYRLAIALREYLRVHMPLTTVLSSQLIALLITFVILVQIADFSRQM